MLIFWKLWVSLQKWNLYMMKLILESHYSQQVSTFGFECKRDNNFNMVMSEFKQFWHSFFITIFSVFSSKVLNYKMCTHILNNLLYSAQKPIIRSPVYMLCSAALNFVDCLAEVSHGGQLAVWEAEWCIVGCAGENDQWGLACWLMGSMLLSKGMQI